MGKNLYEILEIPLFSDVKIVKEAYRNLSRKYHPDNFINAEEKVRKENLNKQQLINMAWETLSDARKKYEYDYDLKLIKNSGVMYYHDSEFRSTIINSFGCDIFGFYKEYEKMQREQQLQQLISEHNQLKEKIKRRKEEIKKKATRSDEYIELEKKEQSLIREELNLQCSKRPIKSELEFKQKQEIDIKNKLLYKLFPKIYSGSINRIVFEQHQIQSELYQINLQINQIKEERSKVTTEVHGGYVKKCEKNDNELIELINLVKELESQIEPLMEEKQKSRR